MTPPQKQEELGFLPHWRGEPEAINADSFDEDVLESPVPVLVEFWAARCAPCRRLAPELAKLAREIGSAARIFTVDVDTEPEAAARCNVHAVPAVLLFVDGAEWARRYGVLTADELRDLIRS